MKLFVRQPYTESTSESGMIVSQAITLLQNLQNNPISFELLTGHEALSADNFQADFTRRTGQAFTPKAFRDWRLAMLKQADAIINLRVGLSESTAFEIAYNIFGANNVPMFFAVWEKSPMKTTLLRDLENLCVVRYVTFSDVSELQQPLKEFLSTI